MASWAAPKAHGQEGGGGELLLLGGGLILGENLVSTLATTYVGEASGYQAHVLPIFGYGMLGILTAYYLNPSENFLVPLVVGSVAGNLYSLYRSNSKKEITLSLGTKSLGMGPEAVSVGMTVGFRDLRLGLYRGDIGDQSYPGPNFAGNSEDFVERRTRSVQSLEVEYHRPIFRKVRGIAGVGKTWATYDYHRYSDENSRANWERTFANYFLETGLGYTLFNRLDIDLQIGYMLMRNQERENFLKEAGSDYTRDNPVQANLKVMLGI